ncbi:hypothetical protein Vretifemale_147 [Volvox reticuliferus]|uniref:Uncharacterized protein n=1 Tax=Volvox reticuliferus TaxID=1737510 RepID=A0A8J4BUA3_9CHLO|nr:hypothetical protein Vretifemale_147 [Volvox reticuliferus]
MTVNYCKLNEARGALPIGVRMWARHPRPSETRSCEGHCCRHNWHRSPSTSRWSTVPQAPRLYIGQEEEEDNMEASEFPGEDSDLPDELLDDLPNPDDLLRLQTRKRRADCLVMEDDPKREEGPLRKRRRITGSFQSKTSSDQNAAGGAAGTMAQTVLLPAAKVVAPRPNRPGKLLAVVVRPGQSQQTSVTLTRF